MTKPDQYVAELEDRLSEPTEGVIEVIRRLEGDILLLGVAGKMGPSLARMARRASDMAGVKRRVIGVARFSASPVETELRRHGIETIRCDLLDEAAVERLPEVRNVVFLAGMKFGATGLESLTWAMNTDVPAVVCRKFCQSRIVALSTGNIYGLVPVGSGGSWENDAPAPVGEYAMSCLGRERIFEHFGRALKIPTALVRLNYACDLRYGVLVDLARRILAGEPVDLRMGWFNTIWQGDANAMILQCLGHVASPPFILNVTGSESLNVRETSERLAALLGLTVSFAGVEAATALLSNGQKAFDLFGPPRVSAPQLIESVADWVKRGGPTLGKPTHFDSRDGKF
ncbi:MAG: NAD-dependent epimerase/dehydratase family protein [Pedosphaera sp.]|nr:NAD-dependent epimerase/dehydratase family protein [Pedosphaera sp.]